MSKVFTPVSLDRAPEFYACWDATPRRSIDYSLANLWGWQPHYGLEWAFENGLCWIRQTQPFDEPVYWAPVGDWTSCDWKAVLPPSSRFIRIPEELAGLWQGQLDIRCHREEARGQWEYLYLQNELATLPGNRFHKKKNHVASFIKTYGEPDFRPLDDRMVEDCLALQDIWCQWHDCEGSPSLQAENEAINRVLSHAKCFRNLCGGALYIEDKIVAFSIGERLDDRTLGVHYEKGLKDIRGVYQAINCFFSRTMGDGYQFLNRAQDLDEEGLRMAKMTYLPADFLKKFSVTID